MLDRLTLDQLRVFAAIHQAGSFTAAAARLRRAQSAVSHAILTLEDALGVALFDRSHRTPRLTEAGRLLAADASAVLGSVEEMKGRAAAMRGGAEAALAIAADAFLPRAMLIAALRAVQADFPLTPITVMTEALGAVEASLLECGTDLGIVTTLVPPASDALERNHLMAVPLIAVVAATHPLASAAPPLSRAVLQRHRQLVLADRGGAAHHPGGGVISTQIWRFADLATRLDFLRAGFGWCNMPRHLVAADLAAGTLVALHIAETGGAALNAPLAVVRRRGSADGPVARRFIAALRAAAG
ncbi:MAG: LysR family transcriptional regulator [Rhodospirillales bacterium]|nr:LysR family transcriptional regulator [Rhodospirillales bacterium]